MRHVESEKNIQKTFSSVTNREQITEVGKIQSINLAKNIAEYAAENKLNISHIYAASSERARMTAYTIASYFKIDVVCDDAFLSVTTDDNLRGKTENEIVKINPKFIEELNLYRCGLFNAYQYSSVADVLKSGTYEKKVIRAFNHIVDQSDETLKVFILHHSSITAILIYIARQMGIYPLNFYGRVEADLGKLYLINHDEFSKKFYIKIANCPSEMLNKLQ